MGLVPYTAGKRRTLTPIRQSVSDGSTLSLDFTTGVLDPRLTFTRSSNATFINYQGYVTVADANMFVNSAWTDANNTPTGWTIGTGTGSVSRSNETRTLTCTAQQYWWYQQPASRSGLTYSVSVEVTAVSGSLVYGDIILAGSSTYINWYKDGVLQATGTSTPVTTGVITLIFTANADNTILRMGLGTAGTNVTGSVTLRYPQFQLGQVPLRSYYENTSTSAARHNSARFDHDPTTLAPRGLLVEGMATTLNQWGEDYTNAYWTKVGSSVSATSVAGPDNVSTATRRIVESATTAQHGIRRGIATTAGQTHTVSVFVKPGSYDSFGFELYWSASYSAKAEVTSISGNTQTVTSASGVNATLTRTVLSASGWYRYALTFTHPSAVGAATPDFNVLVKETAAYAGNGTNYMDVYGFMLETGSGASSYIPTGTSQGTRNADSCVMTGTNFSSWFAGATEGVLFAHYEKMRSQSGNTAHDYAAVGSRYNTGEGLILYNSVTTFLPTAILWPTIGGAVFGGGIATAIPSVTKQALKWFAANDVTLYSNGVVGTTGTGSGTVTPAMLSIGANSANGTEATRDWLNACVRRVKFWPVALPDSQIISITT